MINKPRKQSMRQTVDEHSPTYKRAVAAVQDAINAPLGTRPGEPVKFFRGARVKSKPATEE